MMDITGHLKRMVEQNASDLFFIADSPVRVKLEGKVYSLGKAILKPEQTESVARFLMDEATWKHFERELEVDFAYELQAHEARFRVNAYRERGHVGVVLRYIKVKPPVLEELKAPEILKELVMRKRGLILMCGGTNSGKSTTLAAMVNYRNENQSGHIITIEDPIEFVHPHKKSVVSQRELGVDTRNYAKALRSCMRQSPDVVYIGETRDVETMQAALELCNTGHLALSTLHANNAYMALTRVINLYPQQRHRELYMDLSLNLQAIISQRLVTGVNDRRCAAVEVMLNTPHIAELILRGKVDELKEAMETSGAKGMQSFDKALQELFKQGRITLEEALKNADSASNLKAKIEFG